MARTTTRVALGAAVLAAIGVVATVALATPPSGQHPTTPVTGTLDDSVQVNIDRIKLQTKDPVDVATFSVTYDPGGYSGWHTHPGVLLVTVQSGSVVRQVGCDSTTYNTGDVFVESDEQPSGQVSNPSTTTPAVLSVTQIVPQGSGRRVEGNPPTCG
jgi:quercetin dioxygenase-like cupin family protein